MEPTFQLRRQTLQVRFVQELRRERISAQGEGLGLSENSLANVHIEKSEGAKT